MKIVCFVRGDLQRGNTKPIRNPSSDAREKMPPAGVEPATFGFGGRRSIQLSYESLRQFLTEKSIRIQREESPAGLHLFLILKLFDDAIMKVSGMKTSSLRKTVGSKA